jgi:hypothetical protein
MRLKTVNKAAGTFVWIVACLYLAAAPCVTAVQKERDLLVGRWECQTEYGSWTIERSADGTFEKKGKLIRTIGQPPQEFTVKGRWRLEGKKYIEIWDQVSPSSWTELKGAIRQASVLLLERDKFRRIQADSPVFIETRIQ